MAGARGAVGGGRRQDMCGLSPAALMRRLLHAREAGVAGGRPGVLVRTDTDSASVLARTRSARRRGAADAKQTVGEAPRSDGRAESGPGV